MREVAIIGIGQTKFGELWDRSLRDLWAEAALSAIDEAKAPHIDAVYVANAASALLGGQQHLGALLAGHIGLQEVPATHIEAAEASGGAALRQAYIAVAGGMADYVLVGGVEKMTDLESEYQGYIQTTFGDQDFEGFNGITSAALYAMMAQSYLAEYGASREQLAMVAVQAHANARKNPYAQFTNQIKLETVTRAGVVAAPLGMFDAAPNSDGAAALVLAPADEARKRGLPIVRIAASVQSGDLLALHSRPTLTSFPAAVRAVQAAYKQAGLGCSDISVAELHDAYTIAALIALEDCDFFARGQAGAAVEQGLTAIEGRVPMNPSGGLKAQGAPLGAIGIAQAVEITRQLRGSAANQVKNARVGLTHNIGGAGGTAVVHILKGEQS
jgi:acetyl-CoA C-acetyltransferase